MRFIVRLRNFLNGTIDRYLEDTYEMDANGEELVAAALGPRVTSFVDVGSNQGQWAGMFTRHCPPETPGFLYEPSPWALGYLRERFAGRKNLEIVPLAISDAPGTAEFYELPDSGKSSLIGGWPAADSQGRAVRAVNVQKTTLDQQAQDRGWARIGFLKIDVEGSEFAVMKGARQLLSDNAIGFMQFEFNHPWRLAGVTLRQALDYLRPFGYEVYLIRPSGLFVFDYGRFGEFSALANFLAVSPGSMDQVRDLIREGL